MAKTLDEALSQIFGTNFQTEGAAIEDEAGDTSILTYDQLIQQLKAAYQNAKTSAQTGNWAAYGSYLEQLEQSINQLDRSSTATTAENSDSTTESSDNTTE